MVVEGAPLLLPLVAGALDIGAPAFFLGAAAAAGAEGAIIANNVEIPFVGLGLAPISGLLLVPTAVALAGVGTFLPRCLLEPKTTGVVYEQVSSNPYLLLKTPRVIKLPRPITSNY